MKFDILKDLVLHSLYFKSRPDPVTLGGVGGGNRGKNVKIEVSLSYEWVIGS